MPTQDRCRQENVDDTRNAADCEPTSELYSSNERVLTKNLEPTEHFTPRQQTPGEHTVADSLGPYRIISKLGQGGMGAVYKAVHSRLNKTVAIKILPSDRTLDRRAVMRFQREMKAIGKLRHRNIVHADDADDAAGVHYLVMEYVDGLDFAKLLRQSGPMSVPNACELVRQAAIGLEYARQQGIVHRDIKPSNLMLTLDANSPAQPTGIVKIMDMGLALLEHSSEQKSTLDELTASGQVMGTPDYMAPEQVDDSHQVDTRADVYSLGATLYKLLTGAAPFSGDDYNTPLKKMVARVKEEAPPISSRRSGLPDELVELIGRMLSRAPGQRPSTPGEIAESILSFCVGNSIHRLLDAGSRLDEDPSTVQTYADNRLGSDRSTVVTPTREKKPKRSMAFQGNHRLRLGGIALLVVIAFAAGVFAARNLFDTGAGEDEESPSRVAAAPTGQAANQPDSPKRIDARPFSRDAIGPSDDWIELLPTIDPLRDALGESLCRVGASGLEVSGRWFDSVRVPVVVDGDYELRVVATSTKGHLPNLILPVGSKQVELQFASDRAVLRTTTAETVFHDFAHHEPHEFHVTVACNESTGSVHVKLDGKGLVAWDGSLDELVIERRLNLEDGTLALGIGGIAANIEEIQLKLISGEARKFVPAQEPNVPAATAATQTTPQLPSRDPTPRPVREIAGRYQFVQTSEFKAVRGEVRNLWLSKDGKIVVVQDHILPASVSVWDAENNVKLHDLKIENWTGQAVITDSGERFVTAMKSGKLSAWNPATGKPIEVSDERKNSVGSLRFSPFDGGLYSGSKGGSILHIDPKDLSIRTEFDFKNQLEDGRVYCWGFGRNSNEFVFATTKDVGLYQAEPMEKLAATVPPDPEVLELAISPDAKKVGLRYRRRVEARNFETDWASPPEPKSGYNLETRQFAWMPDNELILMTGGGSGSARELRGYLRLYDTVSGKVMSANSAFERKAFTEVSFYTMVYHAEAGKLALGATNGMVYLFDVKAPN